MRLLLCLLCCALALSACAYKPVQNGQGSAALQGRELISRSLPVHLTDRDGWSGDILTGFNALGVDPTPQNICAVVAVIAQESSFQVDPVVPNLGSIAWREIDRRAAHALIPSTVVHGVLQLRSPNGHTYAARIDAARTEKDLSDIYEDFIATVPLGRTLFENRNPIRTRGPMQVNVAFAEHSTATKSYPYPIKTSIADELFTRRGSIYFGIAHLLDYRAPYDSYLYRFADFNAGQFSSRNAAFQQAVALASGRALLADGALLPHDEGASAVGTTETAVRSLEGRLDLDRAAIRAALEQGRSEEFEGTALYRRTFALVDQSQGHALARAVVPSIELAGPKLKSSLSTSWYAHRVEQRYDRCLQPPG
jgi:Protein of unknown function (DUF1615)